MTAAQRRALADLGDRYLIDSRLSSGSRPSVRPSGVADGEVGFGKARPWRRSRAVSPRATFWASRSIRPESAACSHAATRPGSQTCGSRWQMRSKCWSTGSHRRVSRKSWSGFRIRGRRSVTTSDVWCSPGSRRWSTGSATRRHAAHRDGLGTVCATHPGRVRAASRVLQPRGPHRFMPRPERRRETRFESRGRGRGHRVIDMAWRVVKSEAGG